MIPPKVRSQSFVMSLLALASVPVWATTWHVDPKGSDAKGTGSAETPWLSVNKALGECSPGDAVVMHPGGCIHSAWTGQSAESPANQSP